MQTVQCVKQVPYTVCRQVPVQKTICTPVTVTRQVCVPQTICVPRTICRQVPVEICVKVPVFVPCVLPSPQVSPQSVVTSAQCALPCTTIPPCDVCDKRHPLIGGKFRRF
jgi:hypothetical protein